MNPIDLFRSYYEQFDLFDENSYQRSFDYKWFDTAYDDLNFVYVCSKTTFQQYKIFIGIVDHDFIEESAAISPLGFTNDDILAENVDIKLSGHEQYQSLEHVLKDDIIETDLVFMNKKCFKLIKKSFSMLKEVKRVLYQTSEGLKVELNPLHVKVLFLDNNLVKSLRLELLDRYTTKISISRFMNGNDLKNYLYHIAVKLGFDGVKQSQILLPDIDELGPTEMRSISSGRLNIVTINRSSLLTYDIYDNKLIIFYFKLQYDNWYINFNASKSTIALNESDDSPRNSFGWRGYNDDEKLGVVDNYGVVGLSNIGNTCYMNSALQCMMHTFPLKNYMFCDGLAKEINGGNPLGTKGELLLAFSDLMRRYWRTSLSKISPSKFKNVMSEHLVTFEGYSQHDSQEFLSQMLDALHEDVNRVLRKPYTETIQGKAGDDDLDIARKSWVIFLKRNYSIFIENFYGQFKSTVSCPTCNNTSMTFDPYQIVSLSLPLISNSRFDFHFINADHTEKAMRFMFEAKSTSHYNDISLTQLLDAYSLKVKLPKDRLRFAILGCSRIGEILDETSSLSVFDELARIDNDGKVFLIELNENDMKYVNQPNAVNVYLRTNYEVYDVDDLNRSGYEYYKLRREYEEDPIHIKALYLSRYSSVRDAYVVTLRKLYHVTTYADGNAKDQAYFDTLWNVFETKMQHKIFFYLKIGSNKLTEDLYDKKLDDFLAENQTSILINVFLHKPDGLNAKLNLKHFVSQTIDQTRDLEFESNDISSFASQYSLEHLLTTFSQPEVLNKDNTWYCNHCQTHVQAIKTMEIYKTPRILIIHLKKLKLHAKKLPLVTFPIDELNMDPFVLNKAPIQGYGVQPEEFLCESDLTFYTANQTNVLINDHTASKSLKYKLYGVVNHFGSQHFGHYTAYCEGKEGQWWEFNDGSTSAVSKDKVVSDGAYLLFYMKVEDN